jgi:hypothetical protein
MTLDHSDSLDFYRSQVSELASQRATARIANRSVSHAEVLISAIFANAKECVRLLTGNLREDFYCSPGILASIHRFLGKPNTRLLILSEFQVGSAHRLVGELTGVLGAVDIRHLKTAAAAHYCVMDRVGYRFEFNHHPTQHKIVEAVANFNEPEIAGALADRFDEYFVQGARTWSHNVLVMNSSDK